MENVLLRYIFYGITGTVILLGLVGAVLYSAMGFMASRSPFYCDPATGIYAQPGTAHQQPRHARCPCCLPGVRLFQNASRGRRLTLSLRSIWLWSSAGADIFISVALAYTLHRRITNLGGFNATTEGLVKKLITIALQTAAYTSIISLIGAALSTAYANSTDFHTISLAQPFWREPFFHLFCPVSRA